MLNLTHSYGILPSHHSFLRMTDSPFVILTHRLGTDAQDEKAIWIADECKAAGKLTLAILSLPIICFEGEKRFINGLEGASKISQHVDGILLFNEDSLAYYYYNSYNQGKDFSQIMRKLGKLFSDCFKGLKEILEERNDLDDKPMDNSELIETLRDCGPFTVLTGESEKNLTSTFDQALNSPMIGKFDLHSARNVIIKICTSDNFISEDMVLSEMEKFTKDFPRYTNIKWIFSEKQGSDSHIKVIILATGMDSKL